MKIYLKDYLPLEIIPRSGPIKFLSIKEKDNLLILNAKKCRKQIILPKTIDLEDKDIIAIGLYFVEGNKKIGKGITYHSGELAFINSDIESLKLFLNFMKNFRLNEKDFKWGIEFNRNFKGKINKSDIITYWIDELGLDLKNLRPKWLNYTGTIGSKIPPSSNKYGCLRLSYGSVILRNVLINFINKTFDDFILDKDTKNLSFILAGYFAGDGHVSYYKKSRGRKQVEFLCNDSILMDRLKIALELIGLKNIKKTNPEFTKTHSHALRIYNKPDFMLLYENKILDIIPRKRDTFLGLLNFYKK